MAGSIRKPVQSSRARFILRPLFAALVASGIVAPSHGATIVVSDGGDAGTVTTCTLRQAIESLNGGAVVGACVNTGDPFGTLDTVDLSGRTGTISLGGATALPVAVNMQVFGLFGPGQATLKVSGANASRVFEVSNFVTDFLVANLTVADGKSAGPGGCIYATAPTLVHLKYSVVTGCTANDDPNFGPTPYNGLGGGIFAYALQAEYSTISGNTAQMGGGGVAGSIVLMNQTLVTGNTVLGETIDVTTPPTGDKYTLYTFFARAVGGGGILSTGPTNLVYSVVSNNTVHASRFTSTVDGSSLEYRLGTGGGITSLSLGKYTDPELNASGKRTIAGAGALPPRPTPAKAAQLRSKAAAHWNAPAAKVALLKPKADGETGGLGLRSSTISGNRILGSGFVPNGTQVVAKYAGGGAAFYSPDYNAEFANSTVSGNLLPTGGICVPTSGPPSGNLLKFTCGAGLAGDSAELSNSTVTGNTGATAVQFKYGSILSLESSTASVKSAAMLDALPRLKQALQQRPVSTGARPKASMKAFSAPEFVSTIVASNGATYDVGCSNYCVIGGGADLVGTVQGSVLLPGGTISANPQLAPLANRGGVPAGAPGILGTGPTQTHALYVGSPALNVGANIEGFSYDQRGPGFPRTVGAGTDIGAYEGSVPRPPGASIPALGPWMLGALSALLGALGLWRRRRRG